MDIKDYRTLQLLETIHDAPSPPSQRDMAKSLSVSLGLVNAFLRRLAKKGYFKVTHLPKNRIGYILTPSGVAEKSRLTYAYVLSSYRYYKSARDKFQAVFETLEKNGVHHLSFFGAGELAEIGIASLQGFGIVLSAVFDEQKRGESIMGHPVTGLGESDGVRFDRILVTTSGDPRSAAKHLESIGIPREKIVWL